MSRKFPPSRGNLRSYLAVAGLVLAGPTPGLWVAGTLLVIAGAGLQILAKGCLEQNRLLARGGPYRLVRHPFYLANALVDVGLCLIIGRLMLLLPYGALWALVYGKTIRDEERVLARLFPEEHARYRERVPAIVPWRRPAPPVPGAGFSWRNPNLSQGSALPRATRLLAYPPLFLWAPPMLRSGADAAAALVSALRSGHLAALAAAAMDGCGRVAAATPAVPLLVWAAIWVSSELVARHRRARRHGAAAVAAGSRGR